MSSLMGVFAGLGITLAIVGVFGVMAYAVARRTHEIGIRMALGAQRKDVLRMVTRKRNRPRSIRGRIGLALGAPLMWLLLPPDDQTAMPFNRTSPFSKRGSSDGLASLLASYLPARRATKVDPIVALRHE